MKKWQADSARISKLNKKKKCGKERTKKNPLQIPQI